jgi:hypothetical protein
LWWRIRERDDIKIATMLLHVDETRVQQLKESMQIVPLNLHHAAVKAIVSNATLCAFSSLTEGASK